MLWRPLKHKEVVVWAQTGDLSPFKGIIYCICIIYWFGPAEAWSQYSVFFSRSPHLGYTFQCRSSPAGTETTREDRPFLPPNIRQHIKARLNMDMAMLELFYSVSESFLEPTKPFSSSDYTKNITFSQAYGTLYKKIQSTYGHCFCIYYTQNALYYWMQAWYTLHLKKYGSMHARPHMFFLALYNDTSDI